MSIIKQILNYYNAKKAVHVSRKKAEITEGTMKGKSTTERRKRIFKMIT